MDQEAPSCPFCDPFETDVVVAEHALATAVISRHPINRHHVLVIPRRHVERFTELAAAELAVIAHLAQQVHAAIARAVRPAAITLTSDDDLRAGGYNLVAHWKLHIIPRYTGEAVRIDWARDADPGVVVRASYCAELRQALAG